MSKEGPSTRVTSNLYSRGNDCDSDGNRIDGICKYCKEQDAELKDGGCRDRECKDARLRKKVEAGEALRFRTDVVNDDGKVGTYLEHGDSKTFVEKE